MKTVTIEGQLRNEFGKKATRQIRSQEAVPAVIYGVLKKLISRQVQKLLNHWFIQQNFS
jgi:ribosomal protein L25 (general stress protein Ctc)